MQKYEAGDVFWKTVQDNPADFEASTESGRDHCYFMVTHINTKISVCVDVRNDNSISVIPGENNITFVTDPTAKKLIDWAKKRIHQDKEDSIVKFDNKLVHQLQLSYKMKTI